MSSKLFLFALIFTVFYFKTASCDAKNDSNKSVESEESVNSTDTEPKDLYVIKTVVYEVGILTDASNETDNSTETHEQIDVSFFDPETNGSVIDLSNIPVPILTNVSGVSVTGILPGADLASILLPPNEDGGPVLPKKQITVTQNISTTNPQKGEEIISNLPKLLGLTKRNDSEEETHDHKKEE